MWFDRFRLRRKRILFLSSAPIDEVWTRSTALACRRAGREVEVALCGEATPAGAQAVRLYEQAGISARQGMTFADAARAPCAVAVTASSGLEREIFPTGARTFVHMPHSLASLHMIYPAGAFDGYDVLFAAGPHHEREFAALAAARGLPGRRCYPIGYGKLDVLADESSRRPRPEGTATAPRVLVAPSWGPDNLLDRCGVPLALALADAGCEVVVRPHPLFFLDRLPVLADLQALAARDTRIRIESPLDGDGAMYEADVLVGDYSGTAFEFAALRRKQVVSVDVGLKVANPDWERLGIDPVEVALRPALGPVVPPQPQAVVAAVVEVLKSGASATREDAIQCFLHGRPGECGERASRVLDQLLKEH